jgi:hypothetical protein
VPCVAPNEEHAVEHVSQMMMRINAIAAALPLGRQGDTVEA